jgi:hypothetical protein
MWDVSQGICGSYSLVECNFTLTVYTHSHTQPIYIWGSISVYFQYSCVTLHCTNKCDNRHSYAYLKLHGSGVSVFYHSHGNYFQILHIVISTELFLATNKDSLASSRYKNALSYHAKCEVYSQCWCETNYLACSSRKLISLHMKLNLVPSTASLIGCTHSSFNTVKFAEYIREYSD